MRRSSAASRWSRSRRTRRPSSTRPRRTGCWPRSSSPRAEPRRSASRSPGSAGRAATTRRRTRGDGACRGGRRGRLLPRRWERTRPARRAPGRRPSRGGPLCELGVSLHGLTGTGPGGRIRKLDVLRAGSAPPAAGDGRPQGPHHRRRAVDDGPDDRAAHGAVPLRDPVVRGRHAGGHVDDRRAPAETCASSLETVPSLNDFVVKAAALALREHPAFNTSFVDGRCERHGRVNVGVAVATDEALLVPDRRRRRPQAARRRSRPRRATSPRGHTRGSSRRRSSPPRRSPSRTWACSASLVHRRHQPAAGGDPRGRRGEAEPRGDGRRAA